MPDTSLVVTTITLTYIGRRHRAWMHKNGGVVHCYLRADGVTELGYREPILGEVAIGAIVRFTFIGGILQRGSQDSAPEVIGVHPERQFVVAWQALDRATELRATAERAAKRRTMPTLADLRALIVYTARRLSKRQAKA